MSSPSSLTPQRVTRIVAWSLLAAVVVALVLVGWSFFAQQQLRKVEVAWAGAPSCRGTTPHPARAGGRSVLAVPARPGMHCVLDLRVTNRGLSEVLVRRVDVPFLGPDGGPLARAVPVDGIRPRGRNDRVDAGYHEWRHLFPGRSMRLRVAFRYRRGDCSEGTFWVSHWPSVLVSAWGRTAHRGADRTLALDYGEAGCPA